MHDATGHSAGGFLGRIRCSRTTITLLLSAGILVCVGLIRRKDTSGIPPRKFWRMKVQWSARADVVVAGDSRVLIGVSPRAMSRHLAPSRVANFAFGGTGFSSRYRNATTRVLDPGSPRRIIVLGFSALSLSTQGVGDSGWEQEVRNLQTEQIVGGPLEPIARFFEPVGPSNPFDKLLPLRMRPRSDYEYTADGWVACEKDKPDPEKSLKYYRSLFATGGAAVSGKVVADVMEGVRRWRAEGIRVYAFRPPTTEKMIVLENEAGRYDERALVEELEAAGGVWIFLPRAGYRSYDGSHLLRSSALKLSEELARRIAEHEGIR